MLIQNLYIYKVFYLCRKRPSEKSKKGAEGIGGPGAWKKQEKDERRGRHGNKQESEIRTDII